MNLFKKFSIFGILGLVLTGCSQDNPWSHEDGTGHLRLKLTPNAVVADARPTRAGYDLTPPETSRFGINLTKSDGSYDKSWSSPDEFNDEESFTIGSYTISAKYGEMENEGFDSPHYYGEAEVMVMDGETTEAEITATLANTMVSLEFTNAFRNFFSNYSAQVHSEGHSYIDISRSDLGRPVFLVPGKVDIALTLTQPNTGKTTTIQPAEFEAKARHHYHVTLDYNNGNVGDGQVVISFDDSLVEEEIVIDLVDELFAAAPPVVTPEGFTSDSPFSFLEGSTPASDMKINVNAAGKIKEANLVVNSEGKSFADGKLELNLVEASEADQASLTSWGLVCRGFFKVPSRFAYIDLAGFMKKLPEGEHTLSLRVKDVNMHISDPVVFKVNVQPITLNVSAQDAVFGGNEVILNVQYNGANIKDVLSFTVLNSSGNYVEAPILSVTQVSGQPDRYTVKVRVPAIDRATGKIRTQFNGVERLECEYDVILPEYTVEVDAYAHHFDLQITPEDHDMLPTIVNSLRLFLNGPDQENVTFTRNPDAGLIRCSNLMSSSNYTLYTTLDQSTTDPEYTTTSSFRTETPFSITNGDFTRVNINSLNIPNLQVGGEYRVSPANYHNTSSILYSEPQGWANLNPLTAYTGSSNKNTWFIVASTWGEDNKVYIRSVGYNHNGTTPERSGGAFNTTYYCTNSPTDAQLNKSAGEIFLGTYSYDGTAHRNSGVACSARPLSVSFTYSYTPIQNEQGQAVVRVLSADNKVISSVDIAIDASPGFTTKTVNLPAYTFGVKAAKIEVRFRSTKGDTVHINIPTGSALNDHGSLFNDTFDPNQYHALATGSLLVVDNVTLGYGRGATAAKPAKKSAVRKTAVKKIRK